MGLLEIVGAIFLALFGIWAVAAGAVILFVVKVFEGTAFDFCGGYFVLALGVLVLYLLVTNLPFAIAFTG